MQEYDVVIVGAGPAGGQCARELATAGKKVLLAERSHDFTVNSYSSAGSTNEIMEMFHLPESIIGSNWNKIKMFSSHQTHIWEESDRRGVILDFMKLRSFLAEDAMNNGAHLRMGAIFLDYREEKQGVTIRFKSHNEREIEEISTKVLVDATGSERQVLAKHVNFEGNCFHSTGIEYLIQVSPKIYEQWAQSLSLFIGHAWMPQGYSWIFPMEPNRLKIGVGRYFQNDNFVSHEKSYSYYLNLMIENCLGSKNFPILDKHGKTIIYTYDRKDVHFKNHVIAIGDAVSTINPLAFEGIRHGMLGARIASKHIIEKLNGKPHAFENYVNELKSLLGFKWKLCETIMNVIYKEPKDENIDLIIETLRGFSFNEMFDLSFNYKLFPAMKFLARYSFLTAKHKISKKIF